MIVKIQWWLGNQMFQYALAQYLAQRDWVQSQLDVSYFDRNVTAVKRKFELANVFDINEPYSLVSQSPWRSRPTDSKLMFITQVVSKKIASKLSSHYYLEPWMCFDTKVQSISQDTFVEWFFQSPKYFDTIQSTIRSVYQFDINKLNSQSLQLKQQIENNNHTSVFIHIRRTDYITDTRTNSIHGTCDLDYYHRAISLLSDKVQNPHYFVFSDDIQRVKDHLPLDNATYVDHNSWLDAWQDMALMSYCDHGVIANSTFSWWWAWLIDNPDKKIVAPLNWYNNKNIVDIYPQEWLVI